MSKIWEPGLDTDHQTLSEVLATLPGDDQGAIPWVVRLLENPISPVALPGAVTLKRHDCIHVLLGRGIGFPNEAFVIGFTMGADPKLRSWHLRVLHFFATYINPPDFRMPAEHWPVFYQGVRVAQEMKVSDLHSLPLEDWADETVGVLRERVGIEKETLRRVYAQEQ